MLIKVDAVLPHISHRFLARSCTHGKEGDQNANSAGHADDDSGKKRPPLRESFDVDAHETRDLFEVIHG
jgi:hypothetical protein